MGNRADICSHGFLWYSGVLGEEDGVFDAIAPLASTDRATDASRPAFVMESVRPFAPLPGASSSQIEQNPWTERRDGAL